MKLRDPYEEAHRRALEALRAMTLEERDELFKRAGILDQDGQLAERYRPPSSTGENSARAQSSAQ